MAKKSRKARKAKTQRTIIGSVLLALVVVGGLYALASQSQNEPTVASASTPKENRQPVGSVSVTTKDGTITGWAYDPNTPKHAIDVKFYVDGQAGSGAYIGAVNAHLPSDGHDGDHGFRFPIPAQYQDGKEHSVYAYAIDSAGDENVNLLISYAPKKFTLAKGSPLATPLPTPQTYQLKPGEKASLKAATVIAGDVNINGEKAAPSNDQTGTVVLLFANAEVEAPWGATIIPSLDLETAKRTQVQAAEAVRINGCGGGCAQVVTSTWPSTEGATDTATAKPTPVTQATNVAATFYKGVMRGLTVVIEKIQS